MKNFTGKPDAKATAVNSIRSEDCVSTTANSRPPRLRNISKIASPGLRALASLEVAPLMSTSHETPGTSFITVGTSSETSLTSASEQCPR
ncbi:MAG: hypothetical protein U0269_16870 [Polyangiales bacterium]